MATISIGLVALSAEISGAGEWLMLQHEIGGSLESFSALTPFLDRHFRVLRYDQRGAGRSSRIAGPFSIETQVEDLGALIDKTCGGAAVHIAGVAIGSALAARFAARNPQRVKTLVLACPAPGVSADRIRYLEERAAQVAREGMQATVESSLGNSYPPEVRRDAAAYADYRARFLANDPQSYAAINLAFGKFDATPDLPNIKCPTLVIAGTHDKLRPPSFVRTVADKISGSYFSEIDSGHIMPVQAPRAMASVMLSFYEEIGVIP